MSLATEGESPGFVMPIGDSRSSWLRHVLHRCDVVYLLPLVITVAAFIVAVLAYFH